MKSRNIVVITSDQLRHRYFINRLNAHFPLSAVFIEPFEYPSPEAATKEESEAWEWFFSRRREYESREFGPSQLLPDRNHPLRSQIPKGQLNHPATLEAIHKFEPSYIAIYGTSLLGPEFLSRYPHRILNLHVGLLPYHRGSSCNFWPIYEKRPDLLGTTIHETTSKIDGGPVVAQNTIELDKKDNEQTLAGKTLILGTRLMIQSLKNPKMKKVLKPVRAPREKPYRMRDFTPRAVLKVRRMVESGELKRLIANEIRIRKKGKPH